MKHAGKARRAAFKVILLSLIAVAVIWAIGLLILFMGLSLVVLTPGLLGIWALFSLFTLYFFRDPNPRVPAGANLVVSPAHARVDVIDTCVEPEFMGGECQRISMFLSVIDVHVQCAPVTGRVVYFKYTPGEYLSALKAESAQLNENALIGLEAAEPPGEKVGVRLIAGVIARRIVPWVRENDAVTRGERISLIQFGSRVDVYLPRRARIQVKLGDKVKGGETVIAAFD